MEEFDLSTFYLCALKIENQIEKSRELLMKGMGLSRSDMLVVLAISKDDSSLSKLCKLTYIDKSTMTKIIKKLMALNYVTKTTECQRGYKVMLTEKGKELSNKMYVSFNVIEKAFNLFLEESELEILKMALKKMMNFSDNAILEANNDYAQKLE